MALVAKVRIYVVLPLILDPVMMEVPAAKAASFGTAFSSRMRRGVAPEAIRLGWPPRKTGQQQCVRVQAGTASESSASSSAQVLNQPSSEVP